MRHRVVRVCAADQFALIATRCSNNSSGLIFFIDLLFNVLNGKAHDNAANSQEFFQVSGRGAACDIENPVFEL